MSKTPQFFKESDREEDKGSGLALYRIDGDNNDDILIAVECRSGEGNVPRNASANFGVAKKLDTLGKEFESIAVLARKALNSIKEAGPDNIEIEFGVELGGTAGIPFITEGHANANFNITLKWSKNGSQ